MDLTTIVQFTSDFFVNRGFNIYSDRIQEIDNIQILPWDYLCPLFYQEGRLDITHNTRSIHHYSETWISKPEKIINSITKKKRQ